MSMKIDPDESGSHSPSVSTHRAKAFRDRLASSDSAITRWEIFASEDTKQRVKDIAGREGLTAGIAAEALLVLGIEAYEAAKVSNSGSGLHAPSPRRTSSGAHSVTGPSTLAAYSSRGAEVRAARDEAAASNLPSKSVQDFFDRARKRQRP